MAGHFELMCCTQVLLEEVSQKEFSRDNVALSYRLAMNSSEKTNWAKVNAAIIKRWGKRGLDYIKKKAWGEVL